MLSQSIKHKLRSGSAWSFIGQVFTALMALLLNVLLSRLLEPAELGLYFLIFSVVSALAIVAQLGLTHSVIRFISEAMASKQEALARKVVLQALRVAAIAVFMMIILFMGGGGGWLAKELFHSSLMANLTGLASMWLGVVVFQLLIAEIYRGFHDIKLATIFGGVLTSAISIFVFGCVWYNFHEASLEQAILISVVSGLTVLLISSVCLWKKIQTLPPKASDESVLTIKEMLVVSWPMMVSSVMFFILSQVDLWIVGAFRTSDDVAVYGATLRVVQLITMPLLVMNAVVPPIISELYAHGRKEEMEKSLRLVSSLVIIPSMLLLLTFIAYGSTILSFVFGEFYSSGFVVLLILGIGQVMNVWAGSCGLLLMLTGHQVEMMLITLISGVIVIVFACLLVQSYGVVGVACAAASGMIIQNVIMLHTAKKRLGIWTHASWNELRFMMKKGKII